MFNCVVICLIVSFYACVVLCLIVFFCVLVVLFSVLFVSTVLFYILFVFKYVLYYCHRVSIQLQLTNISYRIGMRQRDQRVGFPPSPRR